MKFCESAQGHKTGRILESCFANIVAQAIERELKNCTLFILKQCGTAHIQWKDQDIHPKIYLPLLEMDRFWRLIQHLCECAAMHVDETSTYVRTSVSLLRF